MTKLRGQAEADYQTAQQQLLGEAGYRQFQDYQRKAVLWDMVNGIAGGATVLGREPFSTQQAEQLVQAMAEASRSYQNGGTSIGADIDWAAVDARARVILSDSQFRYYETTEPPLPRGARFQSRLYALIDKATKAEAETSSTPATSAPGN